jgi:TPR repeat protein
MPTPYQDPLPARHADTQPIPIQDPLQPALLPARAGARAKAWRTWLGGTVAVLILAGAAASYLRDRPASGGLGDAPAVLDIPVVLRPYYDRARTGDVSAMRMLGTMYYNGLNVPQDTREGIRWYRKAAAAGSIAAAKDLEQLGLPVTDK